LNWTGLSTSNYPNLLTRGWGISEKRDEKNRSWKIPEKYLNQWIAIHAAKLVDSYIVTEYLEQELILGAIIGIVKFSKCDRQSQSKWAIAGQYHWHISKKLLLPNPIKCKGALKFWALPNLVQTEIDYLLID
jgi:hypothetical protein